MRIRIVVAALLVAVAFLGSYVTAAPEPSPLGVVFNTAKTANTNILASSLQPTAGRGSVAYRITVGLTSTNSIFNLQVSDGTNTLGLDLNNGTTLTAGRLYTFVVGAHSSYTYNFQVETSTTVGYLLVEEIRDGAL